MKSAKLFTSKNIDFFSAIAEIDLQLPYVEKGISAGFPSPADDFIDATIDLNKEFIKNPSATFYGRVKGNSMKNAGIDNGDLLIIDKSLEPKDGKIAVCYIDGEFTVKRIKLDKDCLWLVPENDLYKPIKVTADNDFIVWGMVAHVIKSF
ncbi:MAG: translesion error-prone DNA polymerase V autoproteolytic subunit [Bacteroidota bacterium]